jgi:DNA-binding NtrC family response regulator
MSSILIIDDNEEILLALRMFLQDHFDKIDTDPSPERIPTLMDRNTYDVIVLDMNFRAGINSGNEGMYWLQRILERDPQAVVVFITAYGDVQLAVNAIQNGAADFIEKPWDEDRLLATLIKAKAARQSKLEIGKLKKKQKHLKEQLEINHQLVYGKSQAMGKVWETVRKVAPTDANILILGENGTGKEVVAHEIHRLSKRSREIFVGVDMGALAPTLFESELFGHRKGAFTGAMDDRSGRFEVASGGTVFLDEIGNLNLEQQAKLLAVLQNREVVPVGASQPVDIDIRLVSATNSAIYERVKEGSFREDLLYRLNTIRIDLPPLRERKEDIAVLVQFFLSKFAVKYQKNEIRLGAGVLSRLKKYEWPGNVRELQNAVEKAVILSDGITIQQDDFQLGNPMSISNSKVEGTLNLEENEKVLIQKAIDKTGGNYSQAVKELGITRKTLYNKIKKYDL